MSTLNTEAPVASSTRSKVDMSESKLPEYESKQPELKNKSVGSSAPAEILVQRIISEHNTVKQLYSQYPNLDAASKLDTGRKIIELIVQHAGREECVLYPAMRKIPELGDKAVNEAIAEHQQTTNDLYELSKLNKADSKFDTQLQKIMKELCDHIAEEESSMLPLFISGASNYDAQQILTDYQNVTVTSLPHPWAPREGLHLTAKAAHMVSVPIDENAIDIIVRSNSHASPADIDSLSQPANKKQKVSLISSRQIHAETETVYHTTVTPPIVREGSFSEDDVAFSLGRVLVWQPIMDDSPEDDDPFVNPKALGEWQIAGAAICVGHANLMVTVRNICFDGNRKLMLRVLHSPCDHSPPTWYRAEVIRHSEVMNCCLLFLHTQASTFRPVDESHIVPEDDQGLTSHPPNSISLVSYQNDFSFTRMIHTARIKRIPITHYGETATVIQHHECMASDPSGIHYLHPGWRTATCTYPSWDSSVGGGVFGTDPDQSDGGAKLIGIHLEKSAHVQIDGRNYSTSKFLILDSVFKSAPLWNLHLLASEAESRKLLLLGSFSLNTTLPEVQFTQRQRKLNFNLKHKEREPDFATFQNIDCLYD